MMDISKALDRANQERTRLGLSWAALARATGTDVSGEAMRNCLSGTTKLTPKMRANIAAAFDWPADWVENPPPPPEVTRRDDQVLEVLATIQQQLAAVVARLDRLDRAADPGSAGSR